MSKYEFSLRQEMLLGKGADILGGLSLYSKKNNIPTSDYADHIHVMYSQMWESKHDTVVILLDTFKQFLKRILSWPLQIA